MQKKTRHDKWRQWVEAKWYWNFLEHVCGYAWFVIVWKLITYLGLSFTHYDGTPMTGSFGLAPLSYWLYLCKTLGSGLLVLGIGSLPFAWLMKNKNPEVLVTTIVIVEGRAREKVSYKKQILFNTFLYVATWFMVTMAIMLLMAPVGWILGWHGLGNTVTQWVMNNLTILSDF